MSKPTRSNVQLAEDAISDANEADANSWGEKYAVKMAQVYATLALVDEVRELKEAFYRAHPGSNLPLRSVPNEQKLRDLAAHPSRNPSTLDKYRGGATDLGVDPDK